MRKRETDRFRRQLAEKRADVLARVQEARSNETEGQDQEAPDLGDRALSTISRDLIYELTTSERQMIRNIDDALGRIDRGSFGECVHCGKNIQMKRLQAVPWARHCIQCQELQDRGEI